MILTAAVGFIAHGQADTITFTKPVVSFDAFLDIFYSYDFNRPAGRRTNFFFNHNRHNEFNLNLGLARVRVDGGRYRATLGLMAGTYAEDNLAFEPPLLKNVYEANVGLRLSRNRDLWLEAGIMSSHLGFESAISTENLTLTRSIMAENSPYYLAGVKIRYAIQDQWTIALLMVNGWQRIERPAGNSLPGFGTQVTFTPNDRTAFNWSTYIGSEFPDDQRRMRYFNDFYAIFQIEENLKLIAGFNIGVEQKTKGSSAYSTWYAPAVLGGYQINRQWAVGARLEYFADPDEVIIFTGTPEGFKTFGLSANLDYRPFFPVLCRIEGRYLDSRDAIFENRDGQEFQSDFAVTASIAVKF